MSSTLASSSIGQRHSASEFGNTLQNSCNWEYSPYIRYLRCRDIFSQFFGWKVCLIGGWIGYVCFPKRCFLAHSDLDSPNLPIWTTVFLGSATCFAWFQRAYMSIQQHIIIISIRLRNHQFSSKLLHSDKLSSGHLLDALFISPFYLFTKSKKTNFNKELGHWV